MPSIFVDTGIPKSFKHLHIFDTLPLRTRCIEQTEICGYEYPIWLDMISGEVSLSEFKFIQVSSSEFKWAQAHVNSKEFKWLQVTPSELNWVQEHSREFKWVQVSPSELKWVQMSSSEFTWIQVGSSEIKRVQVSPSDFKRVLVSPMSSSDFQWGPVSSNDSKWIQVSSSESERVKASPSGSTWVQMDPSDAPPPPNPPIQFQLGPLGITNTSQLYSPLPPPQPNLKPFPEFWNHAILRPPKDLQKVVYRKGLHDWFWPVFVLSTVWEQSR